MITKNIPAFAAKLRANSDVKASPKLFWVMLVANHEAGDKSIDRTHDVEEHDVKYAAARLIALAQAKGIEFYSIEVSSEANWGIVDKIRYELLKKGEI